MIRWVLAVGVAVALAAGLWAFEPWRLFTSSTVVEEAPTSSPAPVPRGSATPTPAARDRELTRGDFEDAEHGTSGVARVLALADGRRFVRLEGLATSDGPDLHVWLTDQPSGGDWGSYDDGRYVRLGELKATHGDQNYEIPAAADLVGLRSVVVWCDRFDVAFGTAPVRL
jgi:Electron transfer DM13